MQGQTQCGRSRIKTDIDKDQANSKERTNCCCGGFDKKIGLYIRLCKGSCGNFLCCFTLTPCNLLLLLEPPLLLTLTSTRLLLQPLRLNQLSVSQLLEFKLVIAKTVEFLLCKHARNGAA